MSSRPPSKRKSMLKGSLLDLHGCSSDEVVSQLDPFIVKSTQKGLTKVRVMTGKGRGIVQKCVIEYLNLGQFDWSYEQSPSGQKNLGVIVVYL